MTARLASILVLATLLASAGNPALAQATATGAQPAPAPAGSSTTAPAGAVPAAEANDATLVETAPAAKHKDAKVEHLVTEDSQVRIEETRVRGVTQKIVVHSKIPGMGSYEIQPKDPALYPQDDHAAGMRLFSFFNFGF